MSGRLNVVTRSHAGEVEGKTPTHVAGGNATQNEREWPAVSSVRRHSQVTSHLVFYGVSMLARRLKSWLVDYLVILAWLGLMAVVVGIPSLAGWFDLDEVWSSRISTDVAITLLTVVPLFVYLTVTESRSSHATLGKRRAGLKVTRADESQVETGWVALRNLVKVLPWQLGHMGSIRLLTAEGEGLAMALNVSALLLLAAVAGPALADRRGIHDLAADTAVSMAR